MIYTHLKCSNKFKLRCYAMLPHCRATLRLPPQTPKLLLGSNTHGSKGVAVLAQAASINWEAIYTLLKRSAKINRITMQCFALQGNLARAGSLCDWKSAPAGARRAPCERLSARCHRKGRRLTDHASSVSVDAVFHSRHRTAAGRTNGQAVRLRLLFVLFFAERKEHVFLLFKGEGYVSISTKKLPFHRKRELFLILTLRRRGTVFALFRRSPETLYRSFR